MKIKNKYNIGDYVWIGKDNPTCHKVEGLNVSIHSNYGIRIFYILEGTPIDIIGLNVSSAKRNVLKTSLMKVVRLL